MALKPTHVRKSNKDKCTFVRVEYQVNQEMIWNAILKVVSIREARSSLKVLVNQEYKVTRKDIESDIRDDLYFRGYDYTESNEFWENNGRIREETKQEVFRIAQDLFPDWFPKPNSIQFVESAK